MMVIVRACNSSRLGEQKKDPITRMKGSIVKTHNAIIYHCVQCGRVVHAEHESGHPQCCGRAMGKSASETIRGGEVVVERTVGRSEPEPPMINGGPKPR
jgi:hypothetical protein